MKHECQAAANESRQGMRYGMKFLTLLFIIFLNTMQLLSQGKDATALEQKVFDLEFSIVNYSSQQDKIKLEMDEYAREISELKQQKSLNYFQRRRLENYLKSSQKLAEQSEMTDQTIKTINQHLNVSRKQLIDQYNSSIDDLVTRLKDNALTEALKKELLQQLTSIKLKRETLQAKLELGIQLPLNTGQITLDADDSPRQIKEKADLLKDWEQKLRATTAKLTEIIVNLNDEIEIQDRMAEFAQELSLFSHQDEPTSISATSDKSAPSYEERYDIQENAFLLDAQHSKSSIFALFPGMTFSNDEFSSLNELDIHTIIKELQQRSKQMLQTADSLKIKADFFYRQAEQAKEIKRQD